MSNTAVNTSNMDFLSPKELTRSKQYGDFQDYIVVQAKEHFDLPDLPDTLNIPVFKERTLYRGQFNPNYVPNPQVLSKVLRLLTSRDLQVGICLKGESGTGKTELALYISYMLNWPITIKQINSNIRADELEGERALTDGNTSFTRSDIVEGYRNGHLILLDEIDKFDPDTAAKLHMPLERKPWSLSADGGELILPHRYTRFLGTANTNMTGNDARFASSQRQDSAFIKRFLILNMPKPTEEEMLKVLIKRFPEVKIAVLQLFIGVCSAINSSGEDLSMDKRELVSWVTTSIVLNDVSIKETFELAYAASLSPHEYKVAIQALDLKMADKKDNTYLELLSKK